MLLAGSAANLDWAAYIWTNLSRSRTGTAISRQTRERRLRSWSVRLVICLFFDEARARSKSKIERKILDVSSSNSERVLSARARRIPKGDRSKRSPSLKEDAAYTEGIIEARRSNLYKDRKIRADLPVRKTFINSS